MRPVAEPTVEPRAFKPKLAMVVGNVGAANTVPPPVTAAVPSPSVACSWPMPDGELPLQPPTAIAAATPAATRFHHSPCMTTSPGFTYFLYAAIDVTRL